ncbi:MAG: ADOP family duplicated permease [Longimicrobiales bacterium]
MSGSDSPRVARAILSRLLPVRDREFILGDLEEEYARARREQGVRRAGRAYWWQGMRSVISQWRFPAAAFPPASRTGSGFMDRLIQDVTQAWRVMMRRPGHTAAVVSTLALAIGLNTAMFSVVDAVLLRPLPFPEPEALVTVWQSSAEDQTLLSSTSDPNFRDWQAGSHSFEALASYRSVSPTLTGLGEAEVIAGARVSEDFFRVLRHPMLMGRTFARAEIAPHAPNLVVVGEAFWRQRLAANPAVLGRTLSLGGQSYQIVGVARAGANFPTGAQLWVNEGINWDRCGRGCITLDVIGRLAPGGSVERAERELNVIAERLSQAEPESAAGLRVRVVTLQDVTVGGVRRALFVLLAAVGMVLLIACANVANLLFAAASARRAEMAVRTSLGASHVRVLRQLLTESVLLALTGALIGTLAAQWAVKALGAWVGTRLPRFDEVSIDGRVLGFALLIMVVAVLLFGFAPALSLARSRPGDLLRGGRRAVGGDRRTRWARAALITSQVAFSITLLLGTGLLLRTLTELRRAPLGFDAAAITTFRINLPAARYPTSEASVRFYNDMLVRLRALPGVLAAGGIAGAPLGGLTYSTSFQPLDRPAYGPGQLPTAMFRPTTPGYFETLRIRLLQGRAFNESDVRGREPVVIVSRALADRTWPGESPLGKRLQMHASAGFPEDHPRTIVGVADNVRSQTLLAVADHELYIPYAQSGTSSLSFMLRTAPNSPSALPAARALLRTMDPELPMRDVGRLSDAVQDKLAAPSLYMALLGLFAAVALALSTIGLYGVVGYQVALRRREVSVRVALGARARDVVRLLAWQGVRPATLGVVLGLLGAAAAVRALERLLYNTSLLDLNVWAGVTGGVLIVALAASVLPASRAARIEPVEALRGE